MEIRIQITDSNHELVYKVEKEVNQQVQVLVSEKIKTIDIEALILKRVNYLIDNSKYVSDTIIRNLVQQRVAKEITRETIAKILPPGV